MVEVSKADIAGLWWTRISRGYQLGLRLKAGSNVKFNGFREQVTAGQGMFSGHVCDHHGGGICFLIRLLSDKGPYVKLIPALHRHVDASRM